MTFDSVSTMATYIGPTHINSTEYAETISKFVHSETARTREPAESGGN